MTATCIPYTQIPHSTALLTDYLYHFDRVSRFYNGSPFDPRSYQSLAAQMSRFSPPRVEMAEILARQNRAFGCGEPTLANIQRLSQPGTFAVVTGQQVGLFSGPAFTLYKALTTVRLARSLSEQGLPCVPIFWLATEDHDLEEVSEGTIFDEEYNLVSLRDNGDRPSPRSPVGEVQHTAEISAAITQMEALLPEGESRSRLIQDLRECYVPGATWGESFARFMTRLFGRWGVILLDPLDEAVHRLGSGVYQQALGQAAELRTGVVEASLDLVHRGYHAQVHVGEDSTLLFVARHGDRMALHQRDGKFLIDGTEEISSTALQSLLAKEPLKFSANVLLRPLVQDSLLPTLAYVAGPSELAYLGQARSLYGALGRPQPVVFPRAAFTLLDSRTDRLMEKYKLSLEDVLRGEEHLGQTIAAAASTESWSEHFDQGERELERLLDRLQGDIEKLDPTLLDTLHHVKEKIQYQMERLRGKLTRAALGRSELLVRHVQAITRFVLPHKDLQERRVGGAYFLGRAGYEVLDRLLAQVQVGCSDHQTCKY
ncbi:MAG: bacillithiol biosynthesis cysteine-adding enzyme BshC [Acidobacteriota bacterium]|nr:bacillithiol biosynthesis cysteine-adding enzyme BshC [Acidobacteriota bacterium]